MLQSHPLTHLVVSGYANNEIRVTRRSPSPVPKNWGDGAEEKRLDKEARRSQAIYELGLKLRQSNGGIVECPYLEYFSEMGTIHPLAIYKSPSGVDLGTYRRDDIEAFRDRLIEEDRAIKQGAIRSQFISPLSSPPPLDISREFQENLNQVRKPSLRDQMEIRFRDLALGFLKVTPRKKSEKLSRYARHTILEAGQIIENECGLNAVFITTTIPGSTREAIATVAENSPDLINRLTQMIRDFGKKTGIEIYWFFTWELQDRGALHPHIVIAAKPSDIAMDELMEFGEKLKNHWYKMLLKLEKTTGVDVFERDTRYGTATWRYSPEQWQSKVIPAEKSVAAYISKYASKDAATKHQKALDTLAARGIEKALPRRWWGCSRNIMALIKSWRFKHTIPVAWLSDPEIEKMLYSVLQGEHLELAQSEDNLSYKTYDKILERALGYRFTVVRDDRVIINGETEVYWFKPEIFSEIHGQIKAISEINYQAVPTPKSTSPKRVIGNSVLSLIANDNGTRRIAWDVKVTGVDPGTGMIVDFEQFLCYQDWQEMQDPWWREETFRMADEEIEWSAKVWQIYLNELRTLTKQNEYELRFGNQAQARELGLWEEVAAQTAIHEMMMDYLAKSG